MCLLLILHVQHMYSIIYMIVDHRFYSEFLCLVAGINDGDKLRGNLYRCKLYNATKKVV